MGPCTKMLILLVIAFWLSHDGITQDLKNTTNNTTNITTTTADPDKEKSTQYISPTLILIIANLLLWFIGICLCIYLYSKYEERNEAGSIIHPSSGVCDFPHHGNARIENERANMTCDVAVQTEGLMCDKNIQTKETDSDHNITEEFPPEIESDEESEVSPPLSITEVQVHRKGKFDDDSSGNLGDSEEEVDEPGQSSHNVSDKRVSFGENEIRYI